MNVGEVESVMFSDIVPIRLKGLEEVRANIVQGYRGLGMGTARGVTVC